jgi:hypothetical protein
MKTSAKKYTSVLSGHITFRLSIFHINIEVTEKALVFDGFLDGFRTPFHSSSGGDSAGYFS